MDLIICISFLFFHRNQHGSAAHIYPCMFNVMVAGDENTTTKSSDDVIIVEYCGYVSIEWMHGRPKRAKESIFYMHQAKRLREKRENKINKPLLWQMWRDRRPCKTFYHHHTSHQQTWCTSISRLFNNSNIDIIIIIRTMYPQSGMYIIWCYYYIKHDSLGEKARWYL